MDLSTTIFGEVHVTRDGTRDFEYVAKIGGAIVSGWCSDRNELNFTVIDAGLRVGREFETSRAHIAAHHRLESRLMDRNLTAVECRDLVRVDVDA